MNSSNSNTSNTNKQICIFHCGDFEIFDYIIKKFPIILKMKLIISFYEDSYYEKIINYPNINILHILKVENRGCDIGPFLLIIKYLLENVHLYNDETTFIKIHTKSIKRHKQWTETLIKDIIETLIFKTNIPTMIGSNEFIHSQNKAVNYNYMKNIYCRYFKNKVNFDQFNSYFDLYYTDKLSDPNKINPFTDLDVNEQFYKKYEKLPLSHWKNHGRNEFHRKSNVNYIKKWALKENYFVAGTMFGFNSKWLHTFKHFDLTYEYSILEEGYVVNFVETRVHAWEYYFGFHTILNRGQIIGCKNNTLQKKYVKKNIKNTPPNYSIINRPFSESKIAFFMMLPCRIPKSGGYRTLLKYIKLLNDKGLSVDIYFGECKNDFHVNVNVNVVNEYGVPLCRNWFNRDNSKNLDTFIENIKKYEVIDINKNNYYIGFRCQRNYDTIVANAWQTAEGAYLNRFKANKLLYIIQDREELFYPNNNQLQKNVIKTYKSEFNYYCITQYLYNYFKNTYNLKNVISSHMYVNLNIYKNYNMEREDRVIIPYYKNEKPARRPKLVCKIIDILSSNNIKCYIYPTDYENNKSENIINLGTLREKELNELYNKYKVGIIFSDSNPSRLGFEMYASGLNVIEYDSEYTAYDMPNEYFTKIKNEQNILTIVQDLFNKKMYDTEFLKNLDMNKDFETFYNNIF